MWVCVAQVGWPLNIGEKGREKVSDERESREKVNIMYFDEREREFGGVISGGGGGACGEGQGGGRPKLG